MIYTPTLGHIQPSADFCRYMLRIPAPKEMSPNDPLNQITGSTRTRQLRACGAAQAATCHNRALNGNLVPEFPFPIPQNRQDTTTTWTSWRTMSQVNAEDTYLRHCCTISLYFLKNPGTTFSGSLGNI